MTKEQRDLMKVVALYRKLMGVNNWATYVHFNTRQDAAGEADPFPQYKTAELAFDLEMAALDRGTIQELVRHELAHLLVAPLGRLCLQLCDGDKRLEKVVEDIEDGIVTDIARMPVWDKL